jgi:hypothetical protein
MKAQQQRGTVMPRFVWSMGLALAGVLAGIAPALAQAAPPDLKGIWKGTGEAIVDGAAATHPRTAEAKPAGHYRLRKQEYSFRIEGQDGRRFWGAIQAGKANIPMLGSLSSDGKWIYIASREGLIDGTVTGDDTIELCYRNVTPAAMVVGCADLQRQK